MLPAVAAAAVAIVAVVAVVLVLARGAEPGAADTVATATSRPETTPAASVDCAGKDALRGEGSTAQQNAVNLFGRAWSAQCPGKTLSFNPTGSGSGRTQFVTGAVDFGASDAPLAGEQVAQAAQRCGGNLPWNLPLVFGPIVLAYNVEGVDGLVVNADVLARIYSGGITRWNDPAIAALGLGAALPADAVVPIYRSDASGTTDKFQQYLQAAAPQAWTKGAGSEYLGGAGEGAQQSTGVIQAVGATPGAIGYMESAFATQAGFKVARIDSGAGPVEVTSETVQKAIDSARFIGVGNDLIVDTASLFTTRAPGAYPLVLVSYQIFCSKGYDAPTAAAVRSYLMAAVGPGQDDVASAGYIPLPDGLKQRLMQAIEAIA